MISPITNTRNLSRDFVLTSSTCVLKPCQADNGSVSFWCGYTNITATSGQRTHMRKLGKQMNTTCPRDLLHPIRDPVVLAKTLIKACGSVLVVWFRHFAHFWFSFVLHYVAQLCIWFSFEQRVFSLVCWPGSVMSFSEIHFRWDFFLYAVHFYKEILLWSVSELLAAFFFLFFVCVNESSFWAFHVAFNTGLSAKRGYRVWARHNISCTL